MATKTVVIGGGNWSASGTWSPSGAPSAADDVVMDITSGNLTVDTSGGAPGKCRSLDQTGYLGTMTMGSGKELEIGDGTRGDIILASGRNSFDAASQMTLLSTNSGNQFTSNGESLGKLTLSAAGTYTFQDDLTCTGQFGLSGIAGNGLLDLTGRTVTCPAFTMSSGNYYVGTHIGSSTFSMSSTKTLTVGSGGLKCTTFTFGGGTSSATIINMGSGTWELTGTGTVWNNGSAAIINCDTSTILISDTSASTKTFTNSNVRIFYNLSVSGAASNGTLTFSSASTWNNWTINSNALLVLSGNQTINNWTLAGNTSVAGSSRLIVGGTLDGASYTYTASSGGLEVKAGGTFLPGGTTTLAGNLTWSGTITASGKTFTGYTNLTVDSSASGTAGTMTGSAAASFIAGTITIGALTATTLGVTGANVTVGGSVTLSGAITASSGTFDATGYTVTGATTFNGSGATFKASTLTLSSTFTFTNGTLTIGSGGLSATTGTHTSGTGTINFGSGTWTFSGNSISFSAASSTLNISTSRILMTNAAPTFTGGTRTFYDLEMSAVTGTASFANAFTCHNLTVTPSTNKNAGVTFSANPTVSNLLTLNGASTAVRIFVASNTLNTARTISAGSVSASYADFRDITASGTSSPWNLSAITGGAGDAGGNTNITFSTPRTLYYSSGTGSFSDAAKWFTATNGGGSAAGNYPLPQDTAIFDANSFTAGSQTVTFDVPRIGSIDFTGATNSPTITATLNPEAYGSITLIAAMTQTGVTSWTLSGRGAYSVTTGTQTLKGVLLNAPGGTYTQQDNFSGGTSTLTFTSGTWTGNGYTLTAGSGLTVNGATVTPGGAVTITGALSVSSGTLDATGKTVTTTTTQTCSGGTYNFGTASCSTFTNSGGTTTGGGTLTLTGALSVTSGTLDNTGFTITGGTTGSCSSTGTLKAGTLVCSSTMTMSSSGTLTIGSGGLSATTFTCTSGAGTINMGSGTWSITSTGTCWNVSSGTWNPQTSTINLTNTSATTKTFAGGGKTYNNLTLNGAASNGIVTFTGANTFGTLVFQPDVSVKFTISTTTTVTTLSISGTSGHLVTVQSTTGGTAATISCANAVSVDYVSLKDSSATGNTPFYAGNNSTNVSGNTNWTFSAPSVNHPLAGGAVITGAATGDVGVYRTFNGSVITSSDSMGDLRVTDGLGGYATITTSATGDFNIVHLLEGDAAAIVDAAGLLSVSNLLGDASVTASGSGSLVVPRALAGASAVAASAEGGLGLNHSFSGLSIAVAAASGTLLVAHDMSGYAATAVNSTGSLVVPRALAGAATVSSESGGALSVNRTIQGFCTTYGAVTGLFVVSSGLQGESISYSSMAGYFEVNRTFGGISSTVATATGDITRFAPYINSPVRPVIYWARQAAEVQV